MSLPSPGVPLSVLDLSPVPAGGTAADALRNTLDLAGMALARQLSHLPVIADPSHATGRRDLVPALSRAALAAGADGLIVEVHPQPERALSDGAQSLDLQDFAMMMQNLPVSTSDLALGRAS